MPTPWDQKKKAEMARMLAEAEAEAISSDARDEDFTMGGDEGGWEAFKAGFGKEATYGFGDEAASALSGVETTDEERIAANEEMEAVINKNAINATLGFVGGIVPSIAGLAYGTLTKAAAKAAALAATKAAGPAAGVAAGKLAAKEVIKKITPLKAIGINAAEGAVSGVGEGEGIEGRIKGAGIGGTIGALVGGGTQAAGKVAQTVYDNSSAGKVAKFISDTSPEEAAAIERAALDAILKKEAGVKSFKLNEKPPDAPETLIDEETGKPYTRDYLERKRITKETERKSPALRRVIREKDVENDDMEMARRKNPNQLPLPINDRIGRDDPAQPELNIEQSDEAIDVNEPFVEPNVNVPFVDDSMNLTRKIESNEVIQSEIERLEKTTGENKPGGSSLYEGGQWANRKRALERLKQEKDKRTKEGSWELAPRKEVFDEEINPNRDMTDEQIQNEPAPRQKSPANTERVIRNPTPPNERIGDFPDRNEPVPEGAENPWVTTIRPGQVRRRPVEPVPPKPPKPTQGTLFQSKQALRPGPSTRLDFSDVDVDEDGNFIYGNTFGFRNSPRRPTADQLPTDEEITSANEAAALTRAMKAKNIPLNEARLAIPGSEMPTKPSTPDAGMKMSDAPRGGSNRPADLDPAEQRSAVLAAIQQERAAEAAAEAAAELPPSVKLERALAEKEYQDSLAIVPSVPKVRSDALFNSLKKTGGILSEDDVGNILTGVTSDASSKPGSLKPDTFKHPLLSEPIEAARKSGAKNLKTLENWEMPLFAYEPGVRRGREGRTIIMIDGKPVDYANALDHLALMNKDIAPIGIPIVRPLGYPPVPGVDPKDIKYKYDPKSFLGQGVYGSVYRVVDRDGRARAAKVLNPGRMSPGIIANTKHERAVSETFRELRENATKEELELYFKHFPVFHQILDNPLDSNGFITVMDELRPMTIEEKTALMSGQAALYDLLKSRNHFDNFTGGPPPRPNPNLTFGLPRSFNVQPYLRPVDNPARVGLLASDYKNMTPKIRKLYTALEYMSDTYGMHWEDLHANNILVDKKTGEYVANDVGLFWNRGVKPPDSAIADEARDQVNQQVANDLAREQIQRKMPADMRPEDPYADMYLSDYEREMAEVADEEARVLNYRRWVARRIAKAQAERLPSTKK